jgi:hypothetical protein
MKNLNGDSIDFYNKPSMSPYDMYFKLFQQV